MLKRLAFIAAGSAVVLTGIAANAQDSEVHYLFNALTRNGVVVLKGGTTGECADPQLYGFYNPANRSLTLCDRSTGKWKTLKHEAWHAVQHCWGGPVATKYTKARHLEALRKLGYPEHQLYTEADARFAAEGLDGFQIGAALDKACAPFRF